MKKNIIFTSITVLIFYMLQFMPHKEYTKEEQVILWEMVKKGDIDATNKLLLYYTTHDFKKNYKKVAKLQYIGLNKNDSQSCYLYGKFMVEFFPEDVDKFKEGIHWLKKAQKLGSEEAIVLLTDFSSE